MKYTIENDYLKLTVDTFGAQIASVIRKCDGVEHMWQADKSVWGYHAPILFPHCGKIVDGKFEAKGKVYESGQHGFARTSEHEFVDQTADTIVLELCANEETLKKFESMYHDVVAYRTYANPYFKVTVGDFRTRSEAVRLLERIKGAFPSAFVVKENIAFPVVDKDNAYVTDTIKVLRPKVGNI